MTGAAARSCSRAEGGSRILSPGKEEALDGDATANCEDHVREIGSDDMLQMLGMILYAEMQKGNGYHQKAKDAKKRVSRDVFAVMGYVGCSG